MAANGISTLTWKRDRQVAKLDLASTNREASGRYYQYDINQLPAVYAEDDNNQANRIKNNSSKQGRPWLIPAYTESGLALYYDPERELVGGAIDDQSGENRDGVIVGATHDLDNAYFSFDGVNDYIRTPDVYGTDISNPDTFSVSLWVYPTDGGVVLSITDTTTPSTAYHFSAIEFLNFAGKPTPYFGIWNAGIQADNGNELEYNQWYHIAQTYNGTVMKGYVNGVEVASVTSVYDSPLDDVTSTNHYFLFGAADTTNMGNGSYYDGRMGEIRIYSDALTAGEVLNNYNSTKERYGY